MAGRIVKPKKRSRREDYHPLEKGYVPPPGLGGTPLKPPPWVRSNITRPQDKKPD